MHDEIDTLLSDDMEETFPVPVKVVETAKKTKLKRPSAHLKSDMYCPKCGIHFLTYYDYDKHILSNPSHNLFQCCQCKKTSKSWHDLRLHYQSVHEIEEYSKLEESNPQKLFCHFCGHKATFIEEISKHVNDKHSRWALKCLLCPEVCQHPQMLFSHFELQHSLVNNIDLECNQCKYHFYDPYGYTLHMSKVHHQNVGTFSYQCVLCPKSVVGEANFILHVHEHANYSVGDPFSMKLRMVNGRPMYSVWKKQCLVCAAIQSDRDQLNTHLVSVHFCNLKCSLCNESSISSMEQHLKTKHALFLSSKAFSKVESQINKAQPEKVVKVCEICYGLVESHMMAQHRKKHEMRGSKPSKVRNPIVDTVPNQNQCTTCNQCHLKVITTVLKWHLRVHAKETYQQSRPQRSSHQSPSSSRRRDTSRSRDELKCTECDRCYDTTENLINHVKAQHFMGQTIARPFQGFMRMPRPGTFMHPHQLFHQSMFSQGHHERF